MKFLTKPSVYIPIIILALGIIALVIFRPESGPPEIIEDLTVTSPVAEQTIGLPLVIEGTAVLKNNFLNYALMDSEGETLVEGLGVTDASMAGELGNFRLEISYPETESQTGNVEVYIRSEGGQKGNPINIPVVFPEVEAQEVDVFFSNAIQNPDAQDCSLVYPVARRLTGENVEEMTLKQLLQGVTLQDVATGYFSNINPGVKINSLTIEEGVAYADFDENLSFRVGGSCRVIAIRSQITETLLQFDGIDEVVISINGDSETALQP